MPLPSRQRELYEKVLEDIRKNHAPGAHLPTEPKYAAFLQCGRTTLRKVLARLQEEKKILRTHRGTFVLGGSPGDTPFLKQVGEEKQEEKPLFMLIPCTQYMKKVDDFSVNIHHQIMAGAMREAIECGSHLVTLPVSETNKSNGIECIDFALPQLKSLGKGDKVIFFGRWFRQILPVIAEKGCKIAYISQLPTPFKSRIKGLDEVAAFTGYSTSAFILAGLKELKKRGKNRSGCIYFYLDEREKEEVDALFHAQLRQDDNKGELLALPFHISIEEKGRRTNGFLSLYGEKLDSLLLCPHMRIAPFPDSVMPIPEHILPVCEDLNGLQWAKGREPLKIDHDLSYSARLLVRKLLKEEYSSAMPYPYRAEGTERKKYEEA